MRAKAERRVPVGPHLTFLFENHETMRYQVLEMVRTERMVKDADIRHEVNTYNELLGARGELAATLLIELDRPAPRPPRTSRTLRPRAPPASRSGWRYRATSTCAAPTARRPTRASTPARWATRGSPLSSTSSSRSVTRRRSPSAATTRTPSCGTRQP